LRRTLLTFLLFAVLISPAALSYLAMAWQKHAIREAVEQQIYQGMPAAELTVLAFAKNEARQLLEWEHEREFKYRGEMYDLVQTQTHGDSIFYTCYHDRAETALNRQLDRYIADWLQHSPVQQEQGERLLSFFRALICPVSPSYDSSALTYYHSPFFHLNRSGRQAGPPAPPPPWQFFSI
jgi:hypothetical protein